MQISLLGNEIYKRKIAMISKWSSYFDGEPSDIPTHTGQIRPQTNQIYVAGLFFQNIDTAIVINNVGTTVKRLLVEECTFHSCYSNEGNGVCIRFNGGLSSVITKVCSYASKNWTPQTDSQGAAGQFSYVALNPSSDKNNTIDYVSVHSTSSFDVTGSGSTIYSVNGICKNDNLNISFNKCQADVALYTFSGGFSQEYMCTLRYSSIADNTAYAGTINFDSPDAKYIIEKCNIIRNESPVSIFKTWDSIEIKESCIIGNTGGGGILNGNYVPILIKCCVSENGEEPSTKFINAILGYSDKEKVCLSSYDSVNGITVKRNIPSAKHLYKRQVYLFRSIFL